MGIFENFSPFVRFCQLIGLFSYRIELNNKFKQLAFTWQHPLSLWTAVSFIIQLLPLVATILFFKSANLQSSIPTTIMALVGVTSGAHFITILINRRVTLRYRQLCSVFDSLSVKVVEELEEFIDPFPHPKNKIKLQTSVGIFLILISVNIQTNEINLDTLVNYYCITIF